MTGRRCRSRSLNALLPDDVAVLVVRRGAGRVRRAARRDQPGLLLPGARAAGPERVRARAGAVVAAPARCRRPWPRARAALVGDARLHGVHADRDRSRAVLARRVLGATGGARGARTLLEFWIEADAFMRQMNRVLVGTMLEVAGGRRSVADFVALLAGRPRRRRGRPRRRTVCTWPASGTAATGAAGRVRRAPRRVAPRPSSAPATIGRMFDSSLCAHKTYCLRHRGRRRMWGAARPEAVTRFTVRAAAVRVRGRSGHGWPSSRSASARHSMECRCECC